MQHPLQRTKLIHKGPVGLPTSRRKEFLKLSDISLGNDDDLILTNKIKLQSTDGEGQIDLESDEKSSGDEDEEDNDITAEDVVWECVGECGILPKFAF